MSTKLNQNQELYIVLFVVWSVIASGGLSVIDRPLFILDLALMVMIIIFSVTKIINFAWLISSVAASLIYLATFYSLFPFQLSAVLQPVLVILVFLSTAGVGIIITNVVGKKVTNLQTDLQILTDLMQYDNETGLLRWNYVLQKMDDELTRSRRYNKKFSIAMIEPVNMSFTNFDEEKRQEMNQGIAKLLQQTCRTNVDIPFTGKHFGVILPETDAIGSVSFAKRLLVSAAHREFLDLRVAIVSFPDDVVTSEEMVNACEITLQRAIVSGESILCYESVQAQERAEDEIAEGINSGAPVRGAKKTQQLLETLQDDELLLVINDFYKMADISMIQASLMEINDIRDIQMIEYVDGRLIYKLSSEALLSDKQFFNIKQLDVKTIQSADKLIEIELA